MRALVLGLWARQKSGPPDLSVFIETRLAAGRSRRPRSSRYQRTGGRVSKASDTTGKLGFEEFKYLWNNIKKWQSVYKQFDFDRSGTIGSSELPGAFEAAGFHLNEHLYNMIIRRYSDEAGNMDFDNFISCLVRLDAMFRAFKSLDKDGTGQIQVNIQEWLQLTMYS
ncbi:hypothetical protein CB1_000743002 [Camelus ferus]|nr:hypothetical protein CB1_000743002 [Camelus ferus]